ncbi:MAG: substrate-binding domain-containing protein [Clostridiales bacterium]|jgi:phosphate transport system substrate-binding protein|nr:substrate-binding domain-containing protein [Clostridiales bacterium]
MEHLKISITLFIMLLALASCSKGEKTLPMPTLEASSTPSQARSSETGEEALKPELTEQAVYTIEPSNKSSSTESTGLEKERKVVEVRDLPPFAFMSETKVAPFALPALNPEEDVFEVEDFNTEYWNLKKGFYRCSDGQGIGSFVESDGTRYNLGRIASSEQFGDGAYSLEQAFTGIYRECILVQLKELEDRTVKAFYRVMGNGEVHELFRAPTEALVVFAGRDFMEMIIGLDVYRYHQNALIMKRADLGEIFDCASVEPIDGEFLLKDSAGYVFARLTFSAATGFYSVEGGYPDMHEQPAFEAKPRPDNWERIVEDSSFNLLKVSSGEDISYSYGSYPCMDGSTVLVPLAMEFARQHLDMDDRPLASFTDFSKTHDAFINLIKKQPRVVDWNGGVDADHSVDLILSTYPSQEDLDLAASLDVKLWIEPICHDAFVFITHKDNPVESLTLDQIRGIYSGEIASWKEVGGEDVPIVAYQRNPNSGSQTAMERLVMQGKPMAPPEMVREIREMEEIVDAVAAYQNLSPSIGYSYKYYIDTAYQSPDIKFLQIDGISPNDASIASNAYPLSASYYGIIRDEDASLAGGKFLLWMLSDEGQRCIEQAGYVPLQ